jgi:hypothetical protein
MGQNLAKKFPTFFLCEKKPQKLKSFLCFHFLENQLPPKQKHTN